MTMPNQTEAKIREILKSQGLDSERVDSYARQIAEAVESQIKSSTDLPTQIAVRKSGTATISKDLVEALGASSGDMLTASIKQSRRSRKNPDAVQTRTLMVHFSGSTSTEEEVEESEEEPSGSSSVADSVTQMINGRQAVPV
jgi:hypothetical protein